MGVVRDVSTDWTDDKILENVTVPFGCGKVKKVDE